MIKNEFKQLLRLRLFILTAFVLTLFSCGGSGGGDGFESSLTATEATAIQAMITQRTGNPAYENVPGMVMGIKKPGKQAWFGSSGYSDLSALKPIKTTDKFRLGSITKTFTATVVLQLAQEGKLTLDDPVAKWLPDVAAVLTNYDLNAIKITNLLHHTSGIHTYTDFEDPTFQGAKTDPYRVWQSSEVLSVINSHKPDFTVGTNWVYSNANYYLLGMIIERVTGDKYENQVKKRIIVPLGMTHTEVPAAGNPYISGEYAHGYMYDDNKKTLVEHTISDPSYPFSAGDVVSNIDDLLTWIHALYYGDLLSPEYHKKQMEFVSLATYGLGNYFYGAGFMVEGDYFIGGHRGQIFVYDCSIQHFIPEDTDMAVCINRSLFDDDVKTYNNTNALILYDTLAVLAPQYGSAIESLKKTRSKQPIGTRTPLTEY